MRESTNFGRQIGLLARLWRTELDKRLRPIGLSQARWVLLVYLSEAPDGMPQLDLAVRAGISGPTLVRQVDQLEEAGLVARQEDPRDRRMKRVSLTAAGRAKFAEADAIAVALRQDLLSEEDTAALEAAMAVNRRVIRRFEALNKTVEEGIARYAS